MTPFATSPSAQVLAWALVHFVWQGSAIGLIALLCLRLARMSATVRYRVGVVALGAMMLAPVATIVVLKPNLTCPACVGRAVRSAGSARPEGLAYAPTASGASRTARAHDAAAAAESRLPTRLSPRALSALLALWGLGVVLFATRLAGGWIVARRWARRVSGPASTEIQAMAARLAERLALGRVARVYESTAARVPMVVGWLKPVILLPAAAIGGLSLVQLEALLAHELAHVRRHDYLVNLLQSVVETLLFYHPAVWWVSREVREAREQCCDDLAVAVCGDRLVYATALTELATMMKPRLALAATDGSLSARVRRILGEPHEAHHRSGFWAPALLAILLSAALVPAGAAGRVPGDDVKRATEVVAAQATQDSAADRAKQDVVIRLERQKLADEQARQEEIKLQEEREAQEERVRVGQQGETARQRAAEEAARREFLAQAERRFAEDVAQMRQTQAAAQAAANQSRQAELAAGSYEYGEQLKLTLAEQYSETQRLLADLRVRFTDAHPRVKAAIAKLEQLEAEFMDVRRARDRAVRPNAPVAMLGGDGVLEAGSVITITLQYGDTRSTIPDVRINADGTTDDLVFGLVFGPIKLGGLTNSQVMSTLSNALSSRQESLGSDRKVGAVSIVFMRSNR